MNVKFIIQTAPTEHQKGKRKHFKITMVNTLSKTVGPYEKYYRVITESCRNVR